MSKSRQCMQKTKHSIRHSPEKHNAISARRAPAPKPCPLPPTVRAFHPRAMALTGAGQRACLIAQRRSSSGPFPLRGPFTQGLWRSQGMEAGRREVGSRLSAAEAQNYVKREQAYVQVNHDEQKQALHAEEQALNQALTGTQCY